MRHFGFRRRGRTRKPIGQTTMHVPATIEDVIAVDTGTIFYAQVPSLLAGGSASSNIEASDRDRTVNVGNSIIGKITFNFSTRGNVGNGTYDFIVFRVERSFITPVIGTDPIPTNSEMLLQGAQQAFRMNLPGRVLHFSQRSYAPEQPISHMIKVNPAKFRMAKVRPGDHIGLCVFNRGSGAATVSVQMRYKESQ